MAPSIDSGATELKFSVDCLGPHTVFHVVEAGHLAGIIRMQQNVHVGS